MREVNASSQFDLIANNSNISASEKNAVNLTSAYGNAIFNNSSISGGVIYASAAKELTANQVILSALANTEEASFINSAYGRMGEQNSISLSSKGNMQISGLDLSSNGLANINSKSNIIANDSKFNIKNGSDLILVSLNNLNLDNANIVGGNQKLISGGDLSAKGASFKNDSNNTLVLNSGGSMDLGIGAKINVGNLNQYAVGDFKANEANFTLADGNALKLTSNLGGVDLSKSILQNNGAIAIDARKDVKLSGSTLTANDNIISVLSRSGSIDLSGKGYYIKGAVVALKASKDLTLGEGSITANASNDRARELLGIKPDSKAPINALSINAGGDLSSNGANLTSSTSMRLHADNNASIQNSNFKASDDGVIDLSADGKAILSNLTSKAGSQKIQAYGDLTIDKNSKIESSKEGFISLATGSKLIVDSSNIGGGSIYGVAKGDVSILNSNLTAATGKAIEINSTYGSLDYSGSSLLNGAIKLTAFGDIKDDKNSKVITDADKSLSLRSTTGNGNFNGTYTGGSVSMDFGNGKIDFGNANIKSVAKGSVLRGLLGISSDDPIKDEALQAVNIFASGNVAFNGTNIESSAAGKILTVNGSITGNNLTLSGANNLGMDKYARCIDGDCKTDSLFQLISVKESVSLNDSNLKGTYVEGFKGVDIGGNSKISESYLKSIIQDADITIGKNVVGSGNNYLDSNRKVVIKDALFTGGLGISQRLSVDTNDYGKNIKVGAIDLESRSGSVTNRDGFLDYSITKSVGFTAAKGFDVYTNTIGDPNKDKFNGMDQVLLRGDHVYGLKDFENGKKVDIVHGGKSEGYSIGAYDLHIAVKGDFNLNTLKSSNSSVKWNFVEYGVKDVEAAISNRRQKLQNVAIDLNRKLQEAQNSVYDIKPIRREKNGDPIYAPEDILKKSKFDNNKAATIAKLKADIAQNTAEQNDKVAETRLAYDVQKTAEKAGGDASIGNLFLESLDGSITNDAGNHYAFGKDAGLTAALDITNKNGGSLFGGNFAVSAGRDIISEGNSSSVNLTMWTYNDYNSTDQTHLTIADCKGNVGCNLSVAQKDLLQAKAYKATLDSIAKYESDITLYQNELNAEKAKAIGERDERQIASLVSYINQLQENKKDAEKDKDDSIKYGTNGSSTNIAALQSKVDNLLIDMGYKKALIGGNGNVSITAGRDLTVKNADFKSSGDLSLSVERDILFLSDKKEGQSNYSKQIVKNKDGLGMVEISTMRKHPIV